MSEHPFQQTQAVRQRRDTYYSPVASPKYTCSKRARRLCDDDQTANSAGSAQGMPLFVIDRDGPRQTTTRRQFRKAKRLIRQEVGSGAAVERTQGVRPVVLANTYAELSDLQKTGREA